MLLQVQQRASARAVFSIVPQGRYRLFRSFQHQMSFSQQSNAFDPSGYDAPALVVARNLLGASLCRRWEDGREVRLCITETEAYIGPEDAACHASKGKTVRTAPMFGPSGHWYVYLCYGIHWMLNLVTGPEGYPAAVLLRGAGHIFGPGRLTRFLQIDRRFNALPATHEKGLWLEEGRAVPEEDVLVTPRIGVAYAGSWAERPFRFVWKSQLPQGRDYAQ